MKQWPNEHRKLGSYSPEQVQRYCVQNPAWQAFRRSMKGKPTETKLMMLTEWWDSHWPQGISPEALQQRVMIRCQVTNYINALRRGGQLNLSNMVVK